MRLIFLTTVASACLAACGVPETSQANNAQANISNDARPPATAAASVVKPVNTDAAGGNQVKEHRP